MPKTHRTADAPPETPPYVVKNIHVSAIDDTGQGLRYDPNDEGISELALDIERNGLMQPIGVTEKPDGNYQLRWGARRLLAHLRLGRTKILAHIYPHDAEAVKVTAIRENLLRAQLTLQEEVDAVCHLHHVENKSPDQIATLLSKSRSWVIRRLAVPALPDELREPLLAGAISHGVAEEIARHPDEGVRRWVLNQAMQSHATNAEVRSAIEAALAVAPQEGELPSPPQTPTTAPTRVYLPCEACGQHREPKDLALVRVCRTGCAKPADHAN